jgi:hypothetical protein
MPDGLSRISFTLLAKNDWRLRDAPYRRAELNGYEGRQSLRIKTETGWKWAKPAKPYSEVLADNMTPSELADGERLVSKWKPNPAECEREAKLAAD